MRDKIDTFNIYFRAIKNKLQTVVNDFKEIKIARKKKFLEDNQIDETSQELIDSVKIDTELSIVIDRGKIDGKLPFIKVMLYNIASAPDRIEYDSPLGWMKVHDDEIEYFGSNKPFDFYYQFDIIANYPEDNLLIHERFLREFQHNGIISTDIGNFYFDIVDNRVARDTVLQGGTLEGFEVFRTTLRYILRGYLIGETTEIKKKIKKFNINFSGGDNAI